MNLKKLIISSLLVIFFSYTSAFAAPLANFKSPEIEVKLTSSSKSEFSLSINALVRTKSAISPEILELDNPKRLVIDLVGLASKSPKVINTTSAFISSLRVGAYPDKTRLVLDIKASELPKYHLEKSSGTSFVIDLSFASSGDKAVVEEEKTPTPTPTLKPTITPTPKATPITKPNEPVVKIKEEKHTSDSVVKGLDEKAIDEDEFPTKKDSNKIEIDEDDFVEETPTPVKTIRETSTSAPLTTTTTSKKEVTSTTVELRTTTSSAVPTTSTTEAPHASLNKGTHQGSELKSIYFQITENTKVPAVAFDVNGLKSYALTKKTEELYELVLDDSYLSGKHLELPQFPPDTFKGFAVINTSEDPTNNKVVVKIYVDEGTKLFPFFFNQQLWIKTGN